MSLALRRLRRAAAYGDRDLDVFKPTVIPFERPPNSRYVTYHVTPQTLEDLRKRCGAYGDAAVRYACWEAVHTWTLFDDCSGNVRQSVRESKAVQLCASEGKAIGFPAINPTGAPSALSLLPIDEQEQVRSIAAEAIVGWHEAGSPRLIQAIARAYGYYNVYKRDYLNV